MKDPNIKQNPHPEMRSDITLTIQSAPGPFDVVAGFTRPYPTAYRRVDTGEVVMVHRGTEEDARDIAIDAGTVLTGPHAQSPMLSAPPRGSWTRSERTPKTNSVLSTTTAARHPAKTSAFMR